MPVIITLNVKNICILASSLCVLALVYNVVTVVYDYGFWMVFSGEDLSESCRKDFTWITSSRPVIGLLGPRGSGVLWLRHIIEQLTGIYTGSVEDTPSSRFPADGKTEEVVAVMTHDIHNLPNMEAGIVVFRDMRDTVRTTFTEQHGPGVFMEAPLHAYYGKEWRHYALKESQSWANHYEQYLAFKKPLMVIKYEELDDISKLYHILLKITNFLHVPVSHKVLECVVENSQSFLTKPKPLRSGLHPFSLLPVKDFTKLRTMENFTENAMLRARAMYHPGKVHV